MHTNEELKALYEKTKEPHAGDLPALFRDVDTWRSAINAEFPLLLAENTRLRHVLARIRDNDEGFSSGALSIIAREALIGKDSK